MDATAANFDERFGGSFAGGVEVLDKFQRLGFGWTRWWPKQKWHNMEPEEGQYDWQNERYQQAFDRGVACHVTLYGWPKWAMEKGHPLPKDMRWKADDERWQDLSIETSWDRFIVAAVENFRGKPVVFEISNEPGFDDWDNYGDEYVKFNERTAALIKKTDADAVVMVNNTYKNPSRPNARLLAKGDLSNIDVWSWHDYGAGWLIDANGMKRMRQMLDEAGTNEGGGEHIDIWFNEGWSVTNTAVDQPIAVTGLTSSESTNAMFNSVVEATVNGQDKTVLFHTAYGTHGMSFWDYSNPGTMLWDWYSYPMPLVPAWNVLNHHIGLSDEVGFVRPIGGNLAIFQDLRNGRGVMIAYADRSAKEDVTIELPDFGTELMAEDAMGNAEAFEGTTLTLSKTGRPVLLYSADKSLTGQAMHEAVKELDRVNAGFATTDGGSTRYALPPAWDGVEKGSSEGSVVSSDGTPIWKVEQVWPFEPMEPGSYRPLVWGGTQWVASSDGFGGQPQVKMKDASLEFGTRASHGTPPRVRTASLSFVVPESGTYQITGSARTRLWEGNNATKLLILHQTDSEMAMVKEYAIPNNEIARFEGVTVEAAAGDVIRFVPQIDGMYAGGTLWLRDLAVTRAGGNLNVGYRTDVADRVLAALQVRHAAAAVPRADGVFGKAADELLAILVDRLVRSSFCIVVPPGSQAWIS